MHYVQWKTVPAKDGREMSAEKKLVPLGVRVPQLSNGGDFFKFSGPGWELAPGKYRFVVKVNHALLTPGSARTRPHTASQLPLEAQV